MRKSVLRIYHIQREEFLPTAYAMIVSFVILILALLLFTKIENQVVTLVTLGFLSFFFLYLLRLLNVINKPFKVGQERAMTMSACSCCMSSSCMPARGDRDLASGDVVEIAEQIEEAETGLVNVDGTAVPIQSDADDRPPAALDDVIDAVTSGPPEPGLANDRRG